MEGDPSVAKSQVKVLQKCLTTTGQEEYLLEVKGCTLIKEGVGYFPDAPTERGVKHLRELAKAAKLGYKAMLAFVIQVENVTEVRPNTKTHPQFGEALQEAIDAGVQVLYLQCAVSADRLEIINQCKRKQITQEYYNVVE